MRRMLSPVSGSWIGVACDQEIITGVNKSVDNTQKR
jgi:hypothetical protein